MSDSLFRQYETWECLGDGYPEAWHELRDRERHEMMRISFELLANVLEKIEERL